MWNNQMTELEKTICKKFGVKYGVFTGNGTTAMYLAFLALGLQHRKVLFPAISCTNPVNAAIFAGYKVDFCDIQLENYTINVDELEKMLASNEYGIVVPTHIYGYRYKEKEVKALCKKYNAILFEDAAQSYYVGNMDVSVMSFGHTKVCDTPLGGGIALTNNKNLEEKIREEKRKLRGENFLKAELFEEYRKEYYKIVKNTDDWLERNEKLKVLQLNSRKYFIFDQDENDAIFQELDNLEEKVEQRRKKAELYYRYLKNEYVIKPEMLDSFCWRYSFIYKGNQEFLLENARKLDIDISSWYYSLNGIYKGMHLKNADILEKHIINLWVDETHTVEQIKKDIDNLNGIMEEDYERNKSGTMDFITSK